MFGKRIRTIIACTMAFVVAAVTPAANISHAAGKTTEYVKEFKLYFAKNDKTIGSFDEAAAAEKAKTWFEENGYHMIEGNLNSGASGLLNKEVGVYMGYSTTTDRKEAVTDIAVMNEKGNYSESEYAEILKKQKEEYNNLAKDMKTQLEEYRKNVASGVKTAIQARDYMNRFMDDDSGRPLGDLLTDISDDDLVTLLLQANGKVVLMIQEKLAYACDTGKTTWLERMEKLGGYDKLYQQYYKAYNNDATKATKAIDQAYGDKAKKLLDSWDDINLHTKSLVSYLKENGLEKASEDEVFNYIKSHNDETRTQNLIDELSVYRLLNTFIYGDTTLLGFFLQDASVFDGAKGIRDLYPLAASLTEGQQASVNESVSLFTMVLDAASAMAFNDDKSVLEKKMSEEKDQKVDDALDATKEAFEDSLKEVQNTEKISIYDGVDRDIFKDGVAVTSTAKTFSQGDTTGWVNALIKNGIYSKVAIGVAAGAVAFGTVAAVYARLYSIKKAILVEKMFKLAETNNPTRIRGFEQGYGEYGMLLNDVRETSKNTRIYQVDYVDANGKAKSVFYEHVNFDLDLEQQSKLAKKELYEKADQVLSDGKMNFYRGMEIGFTVAFIILAVVDITMTAIALYKYYNVDHLPIPHHMVDISYNEDKETSYINYKSVTNQNGDYGDLNGGGGKQWLALYQTHDEDAGDPIVAPGGGVDIKVVTGSDKTPDGYSPLHMFGEPNVVQNLTFADGDNGWSYNDSVNGTYLFFRRDDSSFTGYEEVAEEAKEEETEAEAAADAASGSAASGSSADTSGIATVVSQPTGILYGVGGVVVGIVIGFVGAGVLRKKKRI